MVVSTSPFDVKPNYDHWARMARWHWKEAVTLVLDLDPKRVTLEAAQTPGFPADLKDTFLDRYEQMRTHREAGRFGEYVEPAAYLSWAKSNGFEYPSELARAVAARSGEIVDWRVQNERSAAEVARLKTRVAELEMDLTNNSRTDDKRETMSASDARKDRPLSSKEEKSLLRLVLGMAMDKYDYKPDGGNSAAPARIKDALWKHGIQIDQDTVLKWLRKAAEEVDY